MRELSGKVAVVTGASSGIGRALAVRLAAEGMSLMLADVDPRGLSQTAAMISGVTVLTQITDVSDAPAVQHLANRAFGELGAVHVLCNNAGVFQGGRIWTRTEEDVAWLLGVNVWGVLHGIREFVPRMIEQDTEGHIVNTVSVAGLFAGANTGGQAVSKYAALAASQSLALDLAQIGSKLRVSALCPGGVRTGINRSERVRPADLIVARTRDDLTSQEWLDGMLEKGMEPAEVADAAVDAIRQERFLVLTHPGYEERLREQTAALLAGLLPEPPDGEPRP
ncbi:SDR family NAD(P)-dependent oxidoreductase [Nonomuraea africana]|uniref:NAD(P)-dependent dehydrogenase (Short-subunit alcohol dehydrogenase family) n=1 Tax=Nonomuraea africana TaxID=46171 RepID=A0ABR9KUR0_9ACTN|nr:SDR family NAD(P)-dependent oxidoreductase [Nonomuraea africana]MBE1565470.1 NAD(P)-dependent dehydrogenase (short-subunit alcohol dehydrogenase family) [Nonomuraea africana]